MKSLLLTGRSLLAFLLFWCFCNQIFAQAINTYQFSEYQGVYTPITGGTQILAGNTDTGSSALTNIGFSFNFGGTNYTQFSASTNGYIRLGSLTTGTTPISSGQSGAIAFMARDGKTGGAATYELSGTAPNRVLTVQYPTYFSFYNNSDGVVIDVQVKLYETSNKIEIIYGDRQAGSGTVSYNAQVGLSASSTVYNNRTSTLSWVGTTRGTANAATVAVNSNNYPPSGWVYVWEPTISCELPSSPTISAVTHNSGNISWTAPTNVPENGYEYIVTTDPTLATPAATGTATSSLNLPMSDLESSTVYHVFIRSLCASASSLWQGTSFLTKCAPISVPMLENFDGTTANATFASGRAPSCWIALDKAGVMSNGTYTFPRSGNNVMAFQYSTAATGAWAISPAVQLEAGQSYRLKYYFRNTNTTAWTSLQAFIGNSSEVSDLTTQLGVTYSNITNTTYQEVIVDFTVPSSGVKYIGFKALNTSISPWYLMIDDVSLDLTPTCLPPVNALAESVSTNEATITWSVPSIVPGNGYEYYMSTSNTPPTAATPGVDVPAGLSLELTTLTENTTYYLWLRSDCGDDDFSSWTETPIIIATSCTATSIPYLLDFENVTEPAIPECTAVQQVGTGNIWTTALSGTNRVLRYLYNSANPANTWFYTRGLEMEAGEIYRLSFNMQSSGTTFPERLRVSLGESPVGSAMTTELYNNASVTNSAMQRQTIDFVVPATGTYYVGFQAYSAANMNYLYVDSIWVRLSPACIEPNNVQFTPSSNDALVTFTAPLALPGEGYEYVVSNTNTPPTAETTPTGFVAVPATSFTVTDLEPGITYYVWVRSKCAPTEVSEWTTVRSFTTSCGVAIAPTLMETFSNYGGMITATSLPCWQESTSTAANLYTPTGTTSNWTSDGFLNSGTTGAARINLTSTATNSWLISKAIDLGTTPGEFRVRFRKSITASGSTAPAATYSTHNIDFLISIDGGTTWEATGILRNFSGTNDANDIQQFIDLTTYTGVVKFAFLARSTAGGTSQDFFVDDFQVEYIPACLEPVAVTVSDPTANGFTLAWQAPSTAPADGYEYYVSTSNVAPDAATVPTGATTATTVVVGGLIDATQHYAYVRSVCSDILQSPWTAVATISTTCGYDVAPTTPQTFDSYTGAVSLISLPCWTDVTATTAAPLVPTTTTGRWTNKNFGNGTVINRAAYINLWSSGTGTNVDWLISKSIDLGSTPGLYRVKYDYILTPYNTTTPVPGNYGSHSVDVFVSTDNGATWTTANIIKTHSGTYNPAETQAIINLNNYSGVVKIGFRSTTVGSTPDLDFFVDNFVVEAIPACPDPIVVTGGGVTCLEDALSPVTVTFPVAGTWSLTIDNGTSTSNVVANGANYTFTPTAVGTYTVSAAEGACGPATFAGAAVVTQLPANTANNPQTICFGDSYTIGTSTYTAPGTYTDVFTSLVNGCDSTVTTVLTVRPEITANNPQTICFGDSYTIGTSIYDEAGTYTDVLTSVVTGCDSIVTTVLTIRPEIVVNNPHQLCSGGSVTVGSSIYTTAGTYTDVLTSVLTGCDSTVITVIDVVATLTSNNPQTLCFGDSYTIGTSTYTTAGTYTDVFTSVLFGCDSIVTTVITVLPQLTSNNPQTLCFGDSYSIGTNTYTTAGTYTDVLTSVVTGCDSTVTTVITVLPQLTSNNPQTLCFGDSYSIGTNTYTTAGTYTDVLTSVVTGCDSTVTTVITVLPQLTSNNPQTLCFGDSYSIGTSTYSTAGTYTDVLTSVVTGCDSTVTTVITILPQLTSNNPQTLCFGDSYSIGTSTYSTAGTYTDVLTSAVTGCDSTVTTVITILPQLTSNNPQSICFGGSYTIGTSTYTTAGTFTDVLTSAVNGCDSTVTTVITILPQLTSNNPQTICEGQSYSIGTSTYSTPGTYTDVLTAVIGGCDSTVTTVLTVTTININVNQANEIFTTTPIAGATYEWINCDTEETVATTANFTATANGLYKLVVTVGTCSEESTCYEVEGLKVSSVDAFNLSIYPNPTHSNVTIAAGNQVIDQVAIYDNNGRLIQVIELNEITPSLSLGHLSNGMYFLHVKSNGNTVIKKVTKQF